MRKSLVNDWGQVLKLKSRSERQFRVFSFLVMNWSRFMFPLGLSLHFQPWKKNIRIILVEGCFQSVVFILFCLPFTQCFQLLYFHSLVMDSVVADFLWLIQLMLRKKSFLPRNHDWEFPEWNFEAFLNPPNNPNS